jgi:hypothetical protein
MFVLKIEHTIPICTGSQTAGYQWHPAMELGFANYTRFYRACLMQCGKTPSQLEDEILREYVDWYGMGWTLWKRTDVAANSWNKDPGWVQYRRPYADYWTKALKERPEWIARMRAEIELDERVGELTGE